MNKIVINSERKNIDRVIEPIATALESVEAPHKAIYQVRLSLEELCSNIVNYAYEDKKGKIKVSYYIDKNNKSIRIVIRDNGKEFNPLTKEDPKLTGSVQERKIGGLGIYIVKKSVDEIKYQRENGENVLEIVKHY